MIPAPDWAGRIYGTNTGNLFLTLTGGHDETLAGVLKVNDDRLGLTIYDVEGTFDGSEFTFLGTPRDVLPGIVAGEFRAMGYLNQRGQVEGEWSSTIGTGGRFFLAPHGAPEGQGQEPDQLHIARHDFGPIQIDKAGLVEVADLIQKDFPNPVVVTVTAETERSCYLKRFKEIEFSDEFANIVKIRAQAFERGDVSRVIQIEFGPSYNFILTQSIDEAWARGKKEILRKQIERFQRSYATFWKRLGIGVNQLLFVTLLVFLPSLETNLQRFILVIGFVGISFALNRIDARLKHASIRLKERRPGPFDRWGPSILSWSASVAGAVLAGLLLAVLQGWIQLSPNSEGGAVERIDPD